MVLSLPRKFPSAINNPWRNSVLSYKSQHSWHMREHCNVHYILCLLSRPLLQFRTFTYQKEGKGLPIFSKYYSSCNALSLVSQIPNRTIILLFIVSPFLSLTSHNNFILCALLNTLLCIDTVIASTYSLMALKPIPLIWIPPEQSQLIYL